MTGRIRSENKRPYLMPTVNSSWLWQWAQCNNKGLVHLLCSTLKKPSTTSNELYFFIRKRLGYKVERSHQCKPDEYTNQSVSSEDRWIFPLFTSNKVANMTFCVTVEERKWQGTENQIIDKSHIKGLIGSMLLQLSEFTDVPLQFVILESCHYNFTILPNTPLLTPSLCFWKFLD